MGHNNCVYIKLIMGHNITVYTEWNLNGNKPTPYMDKPEDIFYIDLLG